MIETQITCADAVSKDTERRRRLHILVVTGSYAPDSIGIAPLNTQLCEYLASRGHQVSVVTAFPHYPEWKIRQGYRGKLWQQETLGGVAVHRGYTFIPARRTTLRRILYDTSIGASTALRGLPIRQVDLIFAVSPPLQAGLAGCFLSWLKAAPLLLQVKDLVPDLAIALGMLRNPWAIRLACSLEKYVYQQADSILVISEGFRANLRSKGVPESKIMLIPDWTDTDFIRPDIPPDGFRKTHELAETDFVVLHTGNMGAKQQLENVLEAAAELRGEKQILFCFVGDGTERNHLQECTRRKALLNVKFLPLQPRETLPGMLSAADVLLLNQSEKIVDMVIPSKLLTYMAAGRPVVAAVTPTSEAAQCITRAGCGVVVCPEDPTALAQAIRGLQADPALASSLGRRGRSFAKQNFASNRILERFENHFLSVLEKSDR